MKKILIVAISAALLSACASSPDKLSAAHVSTAGYKNMSCDEIHAEMASNMNGVQDLYSALDKKAKNDQAAMAIGMIIFWPALFALDGGDGPQSAEYSRLKGELNALEKVAIMKNCDDAVALGKERRQSEKEMRIAREKAQAEANKW